MPHCPCTNFITKIVFVQRWAYTWFSRRGLSDSLTNILSIRREKKIHHFFLTLLLRYFDFHLILWIYVTWGGGVKSSLTTTPHMLNQCTPQCSQFCSCAVQLYGSWDPLMPIQLCPASSFAVILLIRLFCIASEILKKSRYWKLFVIESFLNNQVFTCTLVGRNFLNILRNC